MKDTCSRGQKKKPANWTFSDTWRAICSLPDEHFPLILPAVHPFASLFILRQLKRRGYSNCNVTTSAKGLVVHAHR